MRRLTPLSWILLVLLTLSMGACLISCVHPPPTLTAAGQTAFTADQAVVRVNELMNAAIAANASGALPVKTAHAIVQWGVSADQILASTPAGYVQTLTASWTALQPEIASISPTSTVGLLLGGITSVIGGLR